MLQPSRVLCRTRHFSHLPDPKAKLQPYPPREFHCSRALNGRSTTSWQFWNAASSDPDRPFRSFLCNHPLEKIFSSPPFQEIPSCSAYIETESFRGECHRGVDRARPRRYESSERYPPPNTTLRSNISLRRLQRVQRRYFALGFQTMWKSIPTVRMQLHLPTMDKIHALTGELTREACIRGSNATMFSHLLFPGAQKHGKRVSPHAFCWLRIT
jgi:hypothetical protein